MKRKSYEEAIIELEGIVKKLERGELSLEESAALINKRLDEMEKKITILLENEKGEIKEEDFSVE